MPITLQEFNTIWPKIGGVIAFIIMMFLIRYIAFDPDFNIFVFLFWLHLSLLMLHQFEEYVYPGGFKEFFNFKSVFSLKDPQENAPLNETMIAVINLGAWVIFILGALSATSAPWLGIMMVIFNIINVIGHLGVFQIKNKGYNPGFITSLIFLVPFIIIVLIQAWEANILSFNGAIIAFIGGILTAASLPIFGLIQKRKYTTSKLL